MMSQRWSSSVQHIFLCICKSSSNSWKTCARASSHIWTCNCKVYHRVRKSFVSWWHRLAIVIWFNAKFPGWRYGVAWAIIVGLTVLCCNLVFLIVVWIMYKPRTNGLGKFFEGSCKKVDWGSKLAHGVINVLSTLFLGLSSYCMQLLASPTRQDIDVAHKKRQWVDIGISSWRNVWQRHISLDKTACWVLLAISSVPLHLVWNSVVIFSPVAHQYNQLTVTEGFAQGIPFDKSKKIEIMFGEEGAGAQWPDNLQFLQQEIHTYERLSANECKKAYAQHYIRDRADVIVVVEATTANSSIVLGGAFGGMGAFPYEWLCPPESRQNLEYYQQLFRSDTTWTFPDYGRPNVSYCLSKRMPDRCVLEYGSGAAIITIVANTVKVICFFTTYWLLQRKERYIAENGNANQNVPLITTGDAIASFLENPDPETPGMSIVEKEDFRNGIWRLRWAHINPIPWRERYPCRQFRAIGLRRWLTGTIILSAISLVPLVFLLIKLHWLRDELELNFATVKQLGIGNSSGLFLFGEWNDWDPSRFTPQTQWDVLRDVMWANSPQLALSMAYYLWNSHLTVMVAAHEYDMYAATAKEVNGTSSPQSPRSLYVTNPRSGTGQKATPFLVVPFKYWLVNALLWMLLHWLASQAVFFIRVDMLNHWQQISLFSVSQAGYSILGIISSAVISFLVFIFALCIACKKLENRMPLAATCSGALSAACHPRDAALKHHEKKVHWGIEVVEDLDSDEDETGPQRTLRCTFTSLDAHYPFSDRLYA